MKEEKSRRRSWKKEHGKKGAEHKGIKKLDNEEGDELKKQEGA
jgi:hypothetical protein